MAASNLSTIPGFLTCRVGADGTHLMGLPENFLSKHPGTFSAHGTAKQAKAARRKVAFPDKCR